MDSREHECGVCYRTFNAGRRCPRELHCKHSFCESCLRALSRPLGAQRLIVCPLCRHATSISGDGADVRAELRVDECVLERLIVCGVLDQEEEEEEEEEEEGPVGRVCHEPTLPETPAEEGDFSSGSRGGRLRGGWRRVWRSISGKRRSRDDCMSGENMRDLALMSIYMF
uniref:Si:ch73-335l21.4 n=1 Tax=Gasterosteus aculeatus aculeatus TaxID=481459 RepID=A0AAQ4P6F0_GASAC|nr:E3 ubiquitin-protein ligase-like [Gasterosteus aculeatus aculeatus]